MENGNGNGNGDAQNVQNLTKRQLLFRDWLATSKYERIPPTQRALAGDLGVHERTLSRWKEIPGFMDVVVARARSMIRDRLPEIYGALAREAEGGSFQHIKLTLELTGEYKETSERTLVLVTDGETGPFGRCALAVASEAESSDGSG